MRRSMDFPEKNNFSAEEIARGLQAKKVDDVWDYMVKFINESHTHIDKCYELDVAKAFDNPTDESRAFIMARCRAGAQFTMDIWYNAWLNSAKLRPSLVADSIRPMLVQMEPMQKSPEDRRHDKRDDGNQGKPTVERIETGKQFAAAGFHLIDRSHAREYHRGVRKRINPRQVFAVVISAHPDKERCRDDAEAEQGPANDLANVDRARRKRSDFHGGESTPSG